MRYGRRGKPVVAKNFPGSKPNSWGKLSDRIHEEEFKLRFVLITSCLNNQQEIQQSHLAGCWFIEAWHTAECHEPSRSAGGVGTRIWQQSFQKGLTPVREKATGCLRGRVMCQGRAGACGAPGLPPPGCGGCGVLGLLSGALQRGHSHAERVTDGLPRAEDRLRMASVCYR